MDTLLLHITPCNTLVFQGFPPWKTLCLSFIITQAMLLSTSHTDSRLPLLLPRDRCLVLLFTLMEMTHLSFTLTSSPVKAQFTTKEFQHYISLAFQLPFQESGQESAPPSKLCGHRQLPECPGVLPLSRAQEEHTLPKLSIGQFPYSAGTHSTRQLCPQASLSASFLSC